MAGQCNQKETRTWQGCTRRQRNERSARLDEQDDAVGVVVVGEDGGSDAEIARTSHDQEALLELGVVGEGSGAVAQVPHQPVAARGPLLCGHLVGDVRAGGRGGLSLRVAEADR